MSQTLRVDTPWTSISASARLSACSVREPFSRAERVEAATAHLGDVEGLFAQAGHDGLGLETIGVVGTFEGALMRLGVEKLGAFELARFVDPDAQRLAGTVQAVGQQSRKSGVQRRMRYALCHGVSFVGWGKNAPKQSPVETACRGRKNQQTTNLQKRCCTN